MSRKKTPAEKTKGPSPYPPCIHLQGSKPEPLTPRAEERLERYLAKTLKEHEGWNFHDFYHEDGYDLHSEVYVEKECPRCKEVAVEKAKRTRATAAEAAMQSSPSEACRVWGSFFQAERYWAETRYKNPEYEDPTAGVFIDWAFEYPEGRLTAYGEACEAFLKWLQKTQNLSPEEGIARYMPELEGEIIIDAHDPFEICHVLPFTPKCCPASLMCLFEKKIGWVYVVSMEGSELLKIGYCLSTPKKRLDQLQVGNPHRLTMLTAFPCKAHWAPKLEAFMHKLLQEKRQRKTEWFAIDLPTAEEAYKTAARHGGDQRYFWTYEQHMAHEEEMEQRREDYYNEYPWEDPEYEWPD